MLFFLLFQAVDLCETLCGQNTAAYKMETDAKNEIRLNERLSEVGNQW